VMSSASSAVTYTSVYTDSEPGRPVAPPSPDYIPSLEDPQTPPVPQDEDEREPMFVQAHDPDYMPKPIYPEYIPLEDEHEFPAEEQPSPPVDSHTAKSPGYVTESDPEEDLEEYEDDETEDGPVDYPMDEGDDGDDDYLDSSRDDTDDEDEDDEDKEEEEEEHLALTDSTVVPADEHVSSPEGAEPVIPLPSTDITIEARITVRPQASISLPLKAEVERLLAMTTPSPSPLISLLPSSVGERLARCMAPPAHSSPPPVPSPLLPSSGCLAQIQTLKIASTRALIDAVTVALPSPPLLPLPPSLYLPPPVDHRDDIPESEQPPHKSEVGYGIRDTWVDLAEAVPEIAPMTVGEVSYITASRYGLAAGRLTYWDRMTLQETVWMVEEEAYASREAWAHSIGLSQATHQELHTYHDHVYVHETHIQTHQTRLQLQGADGRDSLSDERHEARDGRHANRVASTARTAES
ncbi:hypothetical protein Tco_1426894, partial [Tanacetum coccineum]